MIIKAIAVDDEVLALHKIERFCGQIEYIDLIGKFDSPVDAESFLHFNRVDLMFLDVQMNEFTGLELIRRLKVRPHIILTTAFVHYSLKAFDFDVDDYLLKPIRFERFKKACDKVIKRVTLQTSAQDVLDEKDDSASYIFLKSGRNLERIFLNDILYIEGMKDYLRVVTYKKNYMVLMTFNQMIKTLPSSGFMRVHRSYIVSLSKIEKVMKDSLIIYNLRIPVSKTYRNKILAHFSPFANK